MERLITVVFDIFSWLLIGVALVAVFAGFSTRPVSIVINNDPGGLISDHARWFDRIREAGIPVRVRGGCMSACTLVLALPKEQVCVEPTASFGFHLATDARGKPMVADTQALIKRYYPKPVQDYLATKKLTADLIFLYARDIVAMRVFKPCDRS